MSMLVPIDRCRFVRSQRSTVVVAVAVDVVVVVVVVMMLHTSRCALKRENVAGSEGDVMSC